MIGESRPTSLRVEQGKVDEFRRAIGLDTDGGIAPPTFPAVIEHYGPTVVSLLTDLGLDTGQILHGEEVITYPDGPLRVGDDLHGTIEVVGVTEKRGSAGILRLVRVVTDLRHPDERPAVIIERTFVVLPAPAPSTESR